MSVTVIPRKDTTLNDAIDVLNEHLIKANNDIPLAWEYLRQYDDHLAFVEDQLDKCLDRDFFLENYYAIKTENNFIKTLYPYWDHQNLLREAIDEEWRAKGRCLVIVLKPRQAGITVWVSATMVHRVLFTPNVSLLTVAQNSVTSGKIFKMMNNAYQNLPWWMRPDRLFAQEEKYMEFQRADETQRMTDPGLGSIIQVEHAQKMTGVAIGHTLQAFHGSEVSRWPNADVWTSDIEPSLNAKHRYGVMESTAYGRNGLYFDHWKGSVDGDTDWRAVFIPVYKVRKYIDMGRDYMGRKSQPFILTKEESSFTDKILKEEKYEIPNEFWAFRRQKVKASIRSTGAPWNHYECYPIDPSEAFQSSGVCAFDRMSLQNQRLSNVCKPLWVGEIALVNVEAGVVNTDMIREVADDELLPKRKSDNNQLKRDRLWVWEWPEEGAVYYVGSDTALGVPDGDYSVAEVWRLGMGAEPDTQVAEWWGHCPPSDFAKINAALGFWYRGQNSASEVATEYQGPGITCGDKLKDMDYPNLYRPMHKDRVQNPYTNWFHWMTNQKTRDSIIATMNEALLAHTVCIRSEDLIDEMVDFGSLGGRFEGQGNHDDGVMSSMIGLYCMRETTLHIKQAGVAEESMHRQTADLNVYAVYDNLMRQRGQYASEAQAKEVASDKTGWSVRPLMVCKANTAWSPIFHGSGAHRDLHQKFGMKSVDILPDVVASYQQVLDVGRGDMESDDDW